MYLILLKATQNRMFAYCNICFYFARRSSRRWPRYKVRWIMLTIMWTTLRQLMLYSHLLLYIN